MAFVVFAYDISDNRRRTRVATFLEKNAVRIQGSVFEAVLSNARMAAVVGRLEELMMPGDLLRVYRLPEGAAGNIAWIGGAPPQALPGAWIL